MPTEEDCIIEAEIALRGINVEGVMQFTKAEARMMDAPLFPCVEAFHRACLDRPPYRPFCDNTKNGEQAGGI